MMMKMMDNKESKQNKAQHKGLSVNGEEVDGLQLFLGGSIVEDLSRALKTAYIMKRTWRWVLYLRAMKRYNLQGRSLHTPTLCLL